MANALQRVDFSQSRDCDVFNFADLHVVVCL